jgi:hypothetical protein
MPEQNGSTEHNIADLTRVVGQSALSQKHLLTAQVVMAKQLEKVAAAQLRTEESLTTMADSLASFSMKTQERISGLADRVNALVSVVDSLVCDRPPQ